MGQSWGIRRFGLLDSLPVSVSVRSYFRMPIHRPIETVTMRGREAFCKFRIRFRVNERKLVGAGSIYIRIQVWRRFP